MSEIEPKRMARREAIKWVAATLAIFPALDWDKASGGPGKLSQWTLSDPNLLHPVVPWERTMTKEELKTITALCDVIIPEDEKSPSASKVGVPDFIDEWVSAPYPQQQEDKKRIKEGIVWLNEESKKRFEKEFADLSDEQKTKICDDICYSPKAKPEFLNGAYFFTCVRDLTTTGFYTTKEGTKDLQYIGNTPLFAFKGPPKEVLEYLKLV
jgi:Gluconate 2-dehydrogenase subunit 3